MYRVEKIVCESQYGFCNAEISKYLKSFEGKKYINSKKEIKKYLSDQLIVKERSFQYKFPNTLLINLIERKSICAIKTNENKYYLVSEDGIVVGISDSTSLPFMITAGQDLNIGNVIDKDHVFSLKVLKYLDFLYGIKKGLLINAGSEYQIDGGPKVIFPNEGNLHTLIGSLRLIIQNVTQKSWEYSLEKDYNQITIDLRYKNPIIR